MTFLIPVFTAKLFSEKQVQALKDIFSRRAGAKRRDATQAIHLTLRVERGGDGSEHMVIDPEEVRLQTASELTHEIEPEYMHRLMDRRPNWHLPKVAATKVVQRQLDSILEDDAFKARLEQVALDIYTEARAALPDKEMNEWRFWIAPDCILVSRPDPFDALHDSPEEDSEVMWKRYDGGSRGLRASVVSAIDWWGDDSEAFKRAAKAMARDLEFLWAVQLCETREHLFLPDFYYTADAEEAASMADWGH